MVPAVGPQENNPLICPQQSPQFPFTNPLQSARLSASLVKLFIPLSAPLFRPVLLKMAGSDQQQREHTLELVRNANS